MYLAPLFVGAISVFALAAEGAPRPSKSDGSQKLAKRSEEETERPIDNLKGRCQKMLDMQIAVHDGTKALHKVIEDTPDNKPRPEDEKTLLKLADNEKEIITEATKIVEMLEADKVAIAFPEFFRELRKDMESVHDLLKKGDVGADTEAIEKEIIQDLREIINSLRSR
jgi:phage-related protein